MKARLMRERLAETERHIALGDEHIARQIEIIDKLRSAGYSTALALSVLDAFQSRRAARVARRDAIRKALSLPTDF